LRFQGGDFGGFDRRAGINRESGRFPIGLTGSKTATHSLS
jgi:hypothetical protein